MTQQSYGIIKGKRKKNKGKNSEKRKVFMFLWHMTAKLSERKEQYSQGG